MKQCETLRDDLKAYLDNELPPLRRLSVRWHLSACPGCREEIKAMEQINRELRAGETGGLEAALRQKLLENIPDSLPEGAAEPTPSGWRERLQIRPEWKRKPFIAWGAAATVAIAFFLYNVSGRVMQGTMKDVSTKSAGNALMMYTQNYDESLPGIPTASAGEAAPPPASAPASPASASPKPALSMNGQAPVLQEMASETQASVDKYSRSMAMSAKKMSIPDVKFERQVHREAEITVAVAKVEETSDTVERIVKETGGYIASNQLNTDDSGYKSASLTTKIPVQEFDAFLAKIARLGDVKAKSVNGEDITEKVSDQAHAKRSLAEQIAEMEQKVRTARTRGERRDDMDTLRELRVQAAQAQGRLELLNKLAALATVSVEIQEKAKPTPKQHTGGFMDDINNTAKAAMASFVEAAKVPFLLLIWVAAYAPIWILLAVGYRYVTRH